MGIEYISRTLFLAPFCVSPAKHFTSTTVQRRPRMCGFQRHPNKRAIVPQMCSRLQPHSQTGKRQDSGTVGCEHDISATAQPSRAERMRALWRDPEWRALMLEKRKSPETLRKRSEAARKKWQDPAFRSRMRKARLGRAAWNRGVPPSDVTRLRMSIARKGVKKSDETKRRMSESKLRHPDKSWRRLISESKRGKSKHYFQMRREYRALKSDLRLWSDSYRLTHGRLPKVSNFETAIAAPMLALKVRRYITLSMNLDDGEIQSGREILEFDVES